MSHTAPNNLSYMSKHDLEKAMATLEGRKAGLRLALVLLAENCRSAPDALSAINEEMMNTTKAMQAADEEFFNRLHKK